MPRDYQFSRLVSIIKYCVPGTPVSPEPLSPEPPEPAGTRRNPPEPAGTRRNPRNPRNPRTRNPPVPGPPHARALCAIQPEGARWVVKDFPGHHWGKPAVAPAVPGGA